MEQRAHTLQGRLESFVKLRISKLFDLRRDPFERADEDSNSYYDWLSSKVFLIAQAKIVMAEHIESMKAFPPRQSPAAFNFDEVMKTMDDTLGAGAH